MSHHSEGLKGQVALVTGASAGIGLAVAQRLAAEGAEVYITGRREPALQKAAADIGPQAHPVVGDVASLDDLDRLYAIIGAETGRLDIVVANAGTTPEHFDLLFDTNARGTYFTVQKALPLMGAGGAIVLMSSGMNVKGFPTYGVYAATKAAIRSFGRTWAAELIGRGIRVNVLSPGVIDTPILEKQFSTDAELQAGTDAFTALIPAGRLGRPEEIANGVYYLVSEQSSYTTGFDLVVDGGVVEL
jgi:NAD(P)-dependent dehydrogenase (short-subunit alcohol dehydrogenase family)